MKDIQSYAVYMLTQIDNVVSIYLHVAESSWTHSFHWIFHDVFHKILNLEHQPGCVVDTHVLGRH